MTLGDPGLETKVETESLPVRRAPSSLAVPSENENAARIIGCLAVASQIADVFA
jgi:hypothetical protein